MKKLLLVGLSILLLLTLCACSDHSISDLTGEESETETTESAESSDSTESVATKDYSITESGTYRVPEDIEAGTYNVVVSGDVTFEVIHAEENTVGMQSEKIEQTSDMDATTYAMELSDGTELEIVLGDDGSMELEPYTISE